MIVSKNNKKVKDIVKLKENRNIKKYNKYLIEGIHLIEEALKENIVEEIFIEENREINLGDINAEINYIESKIFNSIVDTIHSQGIIAICKVVKKNLNIANYDKILILDRVQDPGNMGTIIRTADAFGFDCVLIGKGSVNIYSQKVIRSMQGSNFHIDCYDNINIIDILESMDNFSILTTSLNTDNYLEDIKINNNKVAIILGNEGSGVSNDILEKANTIVKINMSGKAESLNVAISAGIIMHYIVNIK